MTEANTESSNLILCKCNCGEYINKFDNRGRPRLWAKGHCNRGQSRLKGDKNPRWNGGKYIDKDGYILILSPNHPFSNSKGYYQQHRLIYENYLSIIFDEDIFLNPVDEIHHIDGNPQNNNISNLMYFPNHSEHVKYEGRIDMSNRVCSSCGSNKTRIRKDGYINWYGNEQDGFICQKCYSKIKYSG